MATRSAEATIKGYYYQFDTSILKLLELADDGDSVVVEGIEDIDINTATSATTVQCKYLSKSQFSDAAIRDPVVLMLDDYRKRTLSINYVLYAHFENETPGKEPIIDLARLKKILTYKESKVQKQYHVEKGISDTTLSAFLSHFKFLFGKEFYSQQKEVIGKLKNRFGCSDFEADIHFYNNALRVIIDKAINKNAAQRRMTKAEFISLIDCRKKLFNDWYIRLRSKEDYLQLAGRTLKSTRALDPIRNKLIIIGKEVLKADNSGLPLLDFLENLIAKFYKLGIALRNVKPLTVVLDVEASEMKGVKAKLIEAGISINDGYEEISFSAEMFNREPVINLSRNATKITKASFLLRIISTRTFLDKRHEIMMPRTALIFSKENLTSIFTDIQCFEFPYCSNLKEIHKVLTH